MGIFKLFSRDKHKKCVKMFERIKNGLDYSTSHEYVVRIDNKESYEELFKMLTEHGWVYDFSGNEKEGLYITVKSK